MPALKKLAAESGLEETKMIIGWSFDFCHLIVFLPENKFLAWKLEVERLIEIGESTAKELESLVGRMTHLSVIVPFVHHFLSQLRDLQSKAKSCRKIKIIKKCMNDYAS